MMRVARLVACVGVVLAAAVGCQQGAANGKGGRAVVIDLSGEAGQPVDTDYYACRIPAAWAVYPTSNDRRCRCPEGFAKATEAIKVGLHVSRDSAADIEHRTRGYVESFAATVSTVEVDGRQATRVLKPFTAPATRKTTWEYSLHVPDYFVLVTDPMDEATKDGLVPYLDAIVATLTIKPLPTQE